MDNLNILGPIWGEFSIREALISRGSASCSKVKQDTIGEYKRHHQTVWPEMLDALRRSGWHNYSLFMGEDGLLFGSFEADGSFQASLDGMAEEEANRRWQEFMAPFFEIPPGARPDQMMVELEEVFHLD